MSDDSKTFEVTILAKGAPVATSEGKVVMCAIGLSDEFGLVRLYPLSVSHDSDVKVWSKVRVTARRSSKDNRKESWRLIESDVIGLIEDRWQKHTTLESCLLKSGTVDPIKYQNEARASICVVKSATMVGTSLDPRDPNEKEVIDPEEVWVWTQNQFPYKPYISWKSVQGSEHRTHIVAQEAYMGMKNNSSRPMRVFENMRLNDPDYEHWIVLGNTKDRRNVWVAPHIHRLKKTDSLTVSNLLTNSGREDGWPYLKQEAINAKDAGLQMLLPLTIGDMN